MVNFEDMFRESKGQPTCYGGKTIQMVDVIEISSPSSFRITRETCKSGWRQGVHLSTDGAIAVNGREIPKSVILWADTAPEIVDLDLKSKKCRLYVKNVWDTGSGTVQSWHNGAAMIVEELPDGRRYRCNDGQPNDDFDDLIFRIEIL